MVARSVQLLTGTTSGLSGNDQEVVTKTNPLPVGLQGRTAQVSVAPAVTASSAYTAGNCVGTPMAFTAALDTALSGILESVTVASKSVQTDTLKLYIFSANPTASTFTDKSAPSINVADVAKVLDIITLNAPDSGLGTHTVWAADAVARALISATSTLYAQLVTTGTPTYGAVSDITVTLGILKD